MCGLVKLERCVRFVEKKKKGVRYSPYICLLQVFSCQSLLTVPPHPRSVTGLHETISR